MFGKEETAAMMFVDVQHEIRPLARCLFAAGRFPAAYSSYRSEMASKTHLPCPDGRLSGLVGGAEVGKKEGVHNVHTLGFGSGRTGAGLGRITEVFGGVADIQGLEPGSSPTSGTVFSLQGLVGL
jgi:hypothetical protein